MEFVAGQIVVLKSNPTIKGVVVEIIPASPENRYRVFVDRESQTFYASQLIKEEKPEDDFQFLPVEQFHCFLTARQIRYPGLSTLFSVNAARIDFIPYQFRPVLRFIRSDRPRLLIADGVGVGKTIEAGLILRELQARRDIRSILIICPRPLITERKWEIEMKRFEERFNHLDGDTLRYCINEMYLDRVWPEQYQRAIIPYSLFDETLLSGSGNNKKGLLDLDPPPRFDLVIVDEAHHIRNTETIRHKTVRFFCDNAEAVVFLTATPIQLGSNDLFVLLNVLRPDLIIDRGSFEHMSEPNPFINQAVTIARAYDKKWTTLAKQNLDKAEETPWGQAILKQNPEFNRIRNRLSEGNIGLEERIEMITELESLNTFSGIINRTRRRDIGEFTVRKPKTETVSFTDAQKELHDEILKIQAEIFIRLHGNANVMFMMSMIRRQAASCLFGLLPLLEEILSRHLDEYFWLDSENSNQQIDLNNDIESRIHSIIQKARGLDPYDPKLEALIKIIRDKQALPNNKVMLFSSFRHTLSYLNRHLLSHGFRVGMIHGGVPDEERMAFRDRFAMDRGNNLALDVLLFSEVGCEGLDYQFCDCIVNYDIPWNPMRIEQRIGRIDRNGQKSETIAIYNMITPGTVDADIYERCLLRIGVFNNALGCGEEILGEITSEIRNIAEDLTLTEEERNRKLKDLADGKIRLIQEQEKLEERQLELFGLRLPQEQIKKEIEDSSSFWLTPLSIQRLVNRYIKEVCGKDQEFILGEKPVKTLRLSQEDRSCLLRDFKKLIRQNSSMYRDWEKFLKGGEPLLQITFDQTSASQHPEIAFVMPLHPLVKQAANFLDSSKRIVTKLKVVSDEVPEGEYGFAIYQWQLHGIKEDMILKPVTTSQAVTNIISGLLEKTEDIPFENRETFNSTNWDELEALHHTLWNEARTLHQKRTQELAEYRRESLNTSHKARMALLHEQLQQTNNEKISKMRQSQIATAQTDYDRHILDLESAMEKADITTELVACGVICVERGK